jgi:heat shock protein beta-11
MTELATEREGCSVVSASSNDLVHSPTGILNTGPTFWISTGIFPQEIVIQLGASSSIKAVDLMSMGIRKIQLDKCDGPQANSWEIVSAQEANDSDGDLQRLSLQVSAQIFSPLQFFSSALSALLWDIPDSSESFC